MTDQDKPVLDEQTLQRLLEAAYVMQEHNREMQELGESLELQSQVLRQQESAQQAAAASAAPARAVSLAKIDYTLTLGEIVETQRQIQRRHLELDKAMALVAERAVKITNASGAGVATRDGMKVTYRAGSGTPALPAGTQVPLDKAICKASLEIGQTIRTEELNTEFFFDPEECRRRTIESLISVPIYHDGKIVGALELYFLQPKGFDEQDVHTCQLMAGLITEAFARDQEESWKKSLATERATMLEVLEKLKPNLAALAAANSSSASSGERNSTASIAPPAAETTKVPCWKCGHDLVAEEQFCGKCGSPRAGENGSQSLQSKVASAWHMQEANQETSPIKPLGETLSPAEEAEWDALAKSLTIPGIEEPGIEEDEGHAELPIPFAVPELERHAIADPQSAEAGTAQDRAESDSSAIEDEQEEAVPVTALAKSPAGVQWGSAAQAREYLEALAATQNPSAMRRFWTARRGDFYLALAVVFVAVVIRWGIWSENSVGASGHGPTTAAAARRKPAPNADLSMFDKLLIDLGLADPPDVPEYKGNPDAQVWVDLHTALYYCPGSDLYGKTPKGKFTSQRDAQLDQFEPATRRACD